ncbi:DUF5680 domain-containing protein [Clostridium sp. DSM 100503]|uniref:DUF5680 domain-containing protein n=1 Tax=Clostridium sp. DSM 100503 TaxID=2963282 RepID=UPI002149F781|nr:DUF5680 domain-containing protein [Clostridium sp. DSM 100503]MCR1951024.1 DUF5680 domain-containing protein [Clostridium sp. DSM 100503]
MGDLSKFKDFIVEAKKNTYASGAKKEKSSRPNSKDYAYKKYNYYYLDSHVGDKEFIGEELVWLSEKVCWGMNYKGQVLVNETPSGFNKFLKKALKNVSEDSPFRGPKYFEDEDFIYECKWDGDLSLFNGVESISHKGNEVFRLYFHGGNLK